MLKRSYESPRMIELGSVETLTEGIKDLLTDNHNGTWQRLSAARPAKKKAAKKKAAPKKKAVKRGGKKR